MKLINKISSLHLINLTLSLFPLTFILGNTAINLNFLIFITLGSIYILRNKINFKNNTTILLLGSLFLFIVFSSSFNLITKYEKDFINVTIDAATYHDDLVKYFFKSLIFLRFFLFVFIFFILANNNLLNLKYLLVTLSVLTFILAIDVIFQDIFGHDMLGIKPMDPGDNSGFFKGELIAGGYLQRFSLPSIFFLGYFLNKKKYSPLFLVMGIVLIGGAIILAGNRMPLPLYLLGLFLFFVISKNYKKEIILGITILAVIFSVLFKYDETQTRIRYESFYGAIKRLYNYAAFQTNKTVMEKTNKDLKIPLTPSSHNEQLDKIFYMKGSGHLELFRAAFYTFKKNYLFGHGMKNFHNECRQIQLEYKKKGTPIDCNSHPHNFFFEVLTSLGILGVFIYSFLILNIFYIFLTKSFGKLNKFDDLNFLVFNSSIITLLIEFFPIRSSGSIFSTSNASYVFLFMALMIGTMRQKKS